MGNEQILGIQVVRVTMTDNLVGDKPAVQLWAAAVSRDEAVVAVKRRINSSWTAELTNQRLSAEQIARLKLRPGDVCELSSGQ
jgi:hypothetical protein